MNPQRTHEALLTAYPTIMNLHTTYDAYYPLALSPLFLLLTSSLKTHCYKYILDLALSHLSTNKCH